MLKLLAVPMWFVLCATSFGDLELSISDISVFQDSGIHQVEVQIRSNSADLLIALASDFRVQGVTFTNPPGVFRGSAFLGDNNISGASSSLILSGSDSRLALLSIDYVSGQLVPAVNSLVAQLTFDTSGVAVGTYQLSAQNLRAVSSSGGSVTASSNPGTITINAIPEPGLSSLLLCGLAFAASRRRKRAA